MKKVKLLLLLLAFLPGLKAAEAGDLYFGTQGLYTTVDKYFGFGARAEYNFWRALEVSAGFNFSPKKQSNYNAPPTGKSLAWTEIFTICCAWVNIRPCIRWQV